MSELNRVLQELEIATAIAAAPAKDLDAARAGLDRRQKAVAALAASLGALCARPQAELEDALRRLECVRNAGAGVEKQLAAVKSDIMAEWNQWSHIYRALGAASSSSKSSIVDYKC